MRRWGLFVGMWVLAVAGCSGAGSEALDVVGGVDLLEVKGGEGAGMDALTADLGPGVDEGGDLGGGGDIGGDLCAPACVGRECGDDGCGGSCGECGAGQCSPAGKCLPEPCVSSKDCPGELVCEKSTGACVECVGNEDCGEGYKCSGNGCEKIVACESDKDCKDQEMVCDKELGECVDCLTADDCSVGYVCVNAACLEASCQPGETECSGNSILVCGPDLQWKMGDECLEGEYCEEGECVACLCAPGAAFCSGNVAKLCNESGSGVLSEKDCGALDQVCVDGECVQCIGDCTGKECGGDGCGGSCGSCTGDLPCVEGICMTSCDVAAAEGGTLGCRFWAVDLDNVEGGQYEPVGLVIGAPSGGEAVEVSVYAMAKSPDQKLTAQELGAGSLTVAPGTTKTFLLPTGFDIDGTSLSTKSFRVDTTGPVSAHQFNPLNGNDVFTNDASLLLPSHLMGTEYIALSWPQRTEGYTLRGFVTVVAIEPGETIVQVWPTTSVKSGPGVVAMAPNPPAPYELVLAMGDVLNLETDGPQGSDLTGTLIVAGQKISVFGGHECANVPLGTNYCDHIEQQLLPLSGWGTEYVGDAFKLRSSSQKDVWRVVAGTNVAVTLNPSVAGPYNLVAGEIVEFSSGESVSIIASGPISVGHYMQGSNYSGFQTNPACSGGTGIGDPAFTLPTPIERFRKEHMVLTPAGYDEDYINIVGMVGTEASLFVDGQPLELSYVPAGSSGYGVIQLEVEDGLHLIKSAGGEIGVTAYGYHCDVSYAYPGG